MKYLKIYEDFDWNEDDFDEEEFLEVDDYLYRESTRGRPTWTLRLGPDSWNKVKHLFDDKGRPIGDILKMAAEGSLWLLYAQISKDQKIPTLIYGVSGDYTFGSSPRYYLQRYTGNKRAAKYVFDWFIGKYLK